jgi:hypothetical protein
MGYAVTRVFSHYTAEEEPPRNNDQDRYMREVRARRMMDIERMCYEPRQKKFYGHSPQVRA